MFVQEYCDKATWDALVLVHPRNHLLQSWGWGEFKGNFGWQPIRLAVQDVHGHVAAAQILFRQMYGLSVAYVPRGPLFSGDEHVDRLLLQALRRVARRRRAAFLRLEPNVLRNDEEANTLHSLLQTSGFDVADPLQPATSVHLSLAAPADKLLAAATKGHRADVRRAERNGVVVRVGSTEEDIAAFYRIMEATAARAHFAIHSHAYYAQAWALLGQATAQVGTSTDRAARLLLADYEGEVVAAFLVFAWGREGQYMYSGANDAGLRSGANHLLQWNAIQWVQTHGCERYDLWGVPPIIAELEAADEATRPALEAEAKQHPLYGTYRFKKGWGGSVVSYLPAYDQVYLLPVYWWWKRRRGGD